MGKNFKKVKNSVLWIRASDEFSKKNLLSEFKRIGVEVNRVVFAEKVKEMSDHHKRLRLADIFLDSSPFSSHSTLSWFIH
jgi:predicted O-linked N-acetylglucosamine transferase (SPINDLY family)